MPVVVVVKQFLCRQDKEDIEANTNSILPSLFSIQSPRFHPLSLKNSA